MSNASGVRSKARVRRIRLDEPKRKVEYGEFGTDVILSITTGRMLANEERINRLLMWLTNQDNLNTRYYSQTFLTCANILNRQCPDLARVVVPDGLHAPLLVRGWVTTRMVLYGGTHRISRDLHGGIFSHSYGPPARSLVLNNAPIAAAKTRMGRRVQTVELVEGLL